MLCLLSFHTTLTIPVGLNFLGNSCLVATYDPNSTTGSIYGTNLNLTLDILYSNASRTDINGFYNFSAGNDPSNTVYGLFLCRGDVNTDVCQVCVRNASIQALQVCPYQKVAIVWYEQCFLRFSDQTIFSKAAFTPGYSLYNPQNITGSVSYQFGMDLGNLLNQAANQAADDTWGKKFAVQEGNISLQSADQAADKARNLYTLAECTPDLSAYDCKSCLRKAIEELPSYGFFGGIPIGGRLLFPSCSVRYELNRFYNTVSSAPPPMPNLYVPVGPPNSAPAPNSSKAFPIAVPVVVVSIVLFIMALVFLKRRSRKRYVSMPLEATDGVAEISTAESLQYSLSAIQTATNNFSVANEIGEGGFGRVYKGVLANGQEVAVKRLSRSSGQGAEEFKNEIVVVAKLQHRNLVRLLGFCLEGEEKILIYEFVPNRSLDYFLFDSEKKRPLNWSKRYKIIGGIARGLLYLHEDSRLRIVHRDLKASNILLDGNMSPKIADFGMAKICGVDQSVGNTNRIAGTFGYMAPEYTRCGQFSVKSDVFSFGVVILEIITGKKNSSFYVSEDSEGLLSYAWKHWRSGDPLALLDSSIGDSYIKNEVIQCVQVGLVCVEEEVSKRPTMASVVQMLNNSSVTLPTPHCPAVFRRHGSEGRVEELEVDQSNYTKRISAPSYVNEASITEPYPR
nr:putative receptor-like protein kinase At4g00960 [Coffea arabica]